MPGQNDLVPGRECGACDACCTALEIADVAMTKPRGLACPNLRAGCGCAIYDARPDTCRSFDCGWRQLADLGDDWRPDRSGVLINFRARSEEGVAVHLIVVGGEDVARERRLAGLAASLVDGGTTTHLVIPGPPGDPGHEIRLNGLLEEAIAARSLDRAHEIVRSLVDALPRAAAPALPRISLSLSYR